MSGFLFGFGMMRILSGLIFLAVFGVLIAAMVRGIGQQHRNNQAPRLTVPAVIVGRRTAVSHHHNSAGHLHNGSVSNRYYVTFQVESGDRMELLVPGQEYGMLIEGDRGQLSVQGTRYLGFQRETGE